MPMPDGSPTPRELWVQAGGVPVVYRALLVAEPDALLAVLTDLPIEPALSEEDHCA